MGGCRRQEAYERELEKYAVRRNPLGMDRHHRFYWSVALPVSLLVGYPLPNHFFPLSCDLDSPAGWSIGSVFQLIDDCRWGVAGQRGVIYVEDFAGRMGVMTQIEDLEAVAAALDRRGVRELALSTAIDKTYKSVFPAASCIPLVSTAAIACASGIAYHACITCMVRCCQLPCAAAVVCGE